MDWVVIGALTDEGVLEGGTLERSAALANYAMPNSEYPNGRDATKAADMLK